MPRAPNELDALHARILRDPSDSELNLRFARLAEASGTLRWALAAYERILVNDPNNIEAQRGLQRVRRALQPAYTLVTAELGAGYETNPHYYVPPKRGEWIGLGSLALRDERSLAGRREARGHHRVSRRHPAIPELVCLSVRLTA